MNLHSILFKMVQTARQYSKWFLRYSRLKVECIRN